MFIKVSTHTLRFNGHFSRWTWVSRVFIEAKDDGSGFATTGAMSRAKLQSNHHHQQTNIQLFLQAGCPSCHPTNSVKALKGIISHSMDLLTLSLPGVFQLCLWPLIAPGCLGRGLPCLSSALPLMPVPHISPCTDECIRNEKKSNKTHC